MDFYTEGSRVGTVFRILIPTSRGFCLEINGALQLFEETPEDFCEYLCKRVEFSRISLFKIPINSVSFRSWNLICIFYRKMMALSVGHVVCLLALVGSVFSCSNPGAVTLTDKTRYSDVIVTGSIESKVGEGKYSLTVDCVLKDSGADIPASLNISGVGKFGKH